MSSSKLIAELRAILSQRAPGRIVKDSELVAALMAAWEHFSGSDDTSMDIRKVDRLEEPEWSPPVLSFVMERHGSTVLGSGRASLQRWFLDLDQHTAECCNYGFRQITPKAVPVTKAVIDKFAEDIANSIRGGNDIPSEWIEWKNSNEVTICTSKVFPNGTAAKETLQGRRRGLREAIGNKIGVDGWKHTGGNKFQRPCG